MSEAQALFNMDFRIIGLGFLGILIVTGLVLSKFDYLKNRFGVRTKRDIERELLRQTVQSLSELRDNHDNDIKKLQDANRLTQEGISSLSQKIDKMQSLTNERFAKNEEKQNKRVRNELKDQISKIYIKCSADKTITNMEFEALAGLIETYEDHNGENSFVHSKVEKEMYTWTRIDE